MQSTSIEAGHGLSRSIAFQYPLIRVVNGRVWILAEAFRRGDGSGSCGIAGWSIDILTLLYQRRQFDYDGKHYHLKLTLMDEMHYPPKPIQQPRIPLWVVGIWPRKRSMQRVLKCDGMFVEKRDSDGNTADVTPSDIRDIKAFVGANRSLTTPFDIVASGKTGDRERAQLQDQLLPWIEAGATWWTEGLWGMAEEAVIERIRGAAH